MNIKYFLLHNHEKKMTMQVWFYSAIYRIYIKFKEPKDLEKYWGARNEESSQDVEMAQYNYARRVAVHVNESCKNTPWESKCLVRAWTAMTLLKKAGIPTTMYLGVGREENKMVAHAWLRCGKIYVTGGKGENYAIVAKFRN